MTSCANKDKSYNFALDKALKHLSYKPRSIYEVQTFLEKKKIKNSIINRVLSYLKGKKYIDDRSFANLFIEQRVRFKPRSLFAIGYELKQKGISQEIIDQALCKYDDIDLAEKTVQIKLESWKKFDDCTFKKKLMNHLRYRGFSFEISLSAYNRFKKRELSG